MGSVRRPFLVGQLAQTHGGENSMMKTLTIHSAASTVMRPKFLNPNAKASREVREAPD